MGQVGSFSPGNSLILGNEHSPGFAIEDEDFDGDLTVVDSDFIRLVDVYIRDVFQNHLDAKKP